MGRHETKPFITVDNPSSSESFEPNGIRRVILSISKKLIGRDRVTAISQKIRWAKTKRNLEQYYQKALQNADMAVIAGAGTIKWGIRRDYSRYYGLVEKYASKYHIPVIVSSVGVEDSFNKRDRRCIRFSKILSSNSLIIVTTRDNISELRKYVSNPMTDVERVSDFGIFAADTYGIK